MPYLVIMSGPQKGRRFAITDSITRVGRVVGNHIVLDNISVSSGHAEIVRENQSFRLRDLDSTNGTRVNGHRVTDTLLFRDDQLLLGDLPVVFCGEDAPAREKQDIPAQASDEAKVSEPKPAAAAAVTTPSQAVETKPVPLPMPRPTSANPPTTVLRPTVVVASTLSGKHASLSMPVDFQKRRDARLVWVVVIVLLLVGIAFGVWKFYHALVDKITP